MCIVTYKNSFKKIVMTCALLLIAVTLMSCRKSVETIGDSALTELSVTQIEDKNNCPIRELSDYLDEVSEVPYAYAQILFKAEPVAPSDSDSDTETDPTPNTASALNRKASYALLPAICLSSYEKNDFYSDYGVDASADISWETFQTAEEFQEYLTARENEDTTSKNSDYIMELSYYRYQLEDDVHAIDINNFLQERYVDEIGDDNPLYALTLDGNDDSYCFSQSGGRKMVVKDEVFYSWENKWISDEVDTEFVSELLMSFCTDKMEVKEFNGWVLSDEELYWIDHDSRYTQFENPTRSFTEIKAVDENWEGRRLMENFALFTEADYQLELCENGPAININFSLSGEIPETGYSEYLLNGFCTDKAYDMTVTDARTGEIIQNQQVSMSIEIPDMIDFMDLDWDGYVDMKIELPTHSSGERATINAYSKKLYMLWNSEKNRFEPKKEKEVAEIIRQNQAKDADLTEYVVVSGDTLWGISRRFYKTGTLYTEIEKENEEILSYYKYLMPGTRLKIPKILLQEQESPLFCLYCSNSDY